jgi:hypothetical protein
MSLYVLVFVGVTPFGAFVVGWLAEHYGISFACAVGGGLGLAAVLTLSLFWQLRQRRAGEA